MCRLYSSSAALLKQEFFKKWIKGLQIYSSLKTEMTIFERKRAIKFSADVAIASAGNAASHWRRTLIADVETEAASEGGAARTVVEQILGRKLAEKKAPTIACSKKIVRRSRLSRWRKAAAAARVVPSTSIAKKMVRNRTRVLKRIVPGGERLDEMSLIKETLDYVASLQVQVHVMRNLAAAADRLDHHQQMLF